MKKLNRFFIFIATLIVLLVVSSSVHASAFKSVDWEEISSRELSSEGKAALAINRDTWQHAESENFVYHFRNEKEVETFLIHSEMYYQWIKDLFGTKDEKWQEKSHIFIFEDKLLWKEFNLSSPERLPGAEGFTNGQDLFIYRDPFWMTPQIVLAHEITHLVLYRMLKGWPLLFLNEGFAEFMSIKAAAMKADGNEFNIRSIKLVSDEQYIPLKKLAAFKQYPSSEEEVKIFYRQSELLARYLLLNYDKSNFYGLLKETSQGQTFESSLKDIYDLDLNSLEDKFKAYALVASKK